MADYDFSVIERAGLTQQDYADLVGVSRISANHHVTGKRLPSPRRAAKVRAVLALLQRRIDEGRLPCQLPSTRRDGRKARLKALIEALR